MPPRPPTGAGGFDTIPHFSYYDLMQNKSVGESVAIILGVATVFVVQISFLSAYASYLLAFFIIFSIIYITLKKRSINSTQLFSGNPIELYGLTAIVVFIVAITNGLTSPLFFFLYLLLFLFAFMGEAITVWVFLTAVTLYFLPQASADLDSNTFIKLGSLLLITPISYFVAKEFERRKLLNQQIDEKTDEIIQEAEALKESVNPVQAEEQEVIDEIIEEAESLKQDSRI